MAADDSHLATIWVVEREAIRRDVGFFAESVLSTRDVAITHIEHGRQQSPSIRWSIPPLRIDDDEPH